MLRIVTYNIIYSGFFEMLGFGILAFAAIHIFDIAKDLLPGIITGLMYGFTMVLLIRRNADRYHYWHIQLPIGINERAWARVLTLFFPVLLFALLSMLISFIMASNAHNIAESFYAPVVSLAGIYGGLGSYYLLKDHSASKKVITANSIVIFLLPIFITLGLMILPVWLIVFLETGEMEKHLILVSSIAASVFLLFSTILSYKKRTSFID